MVGHARDHGTPYMQGNDACIPANMHVHVVKRKSCATAAALLHDLSDVYECSIPLNPGGATVGGIPSSAGDDKPHIRTAVPSLADVYANMEAASTLDDDGSQVPRNAADWPAEPLAGQLVDALDAAGKNSLEDHFDRESFL